MQTASKKSIKIKCGKIDFIVKTKHKDSVDFITTHGTLIFSNGKKNKKTGLNDLGYINLLYVEDSIQYISNPKVVVRIDHKHKSVDIDSSEDAQSHLRYMFSEFIAFYCNNLEYKWIVYVLPGKTKDTDSSMIFILHKKKIRPEMTAKYQKKAFQEEQKQIKKNGSDPSYMEKRIFASYEDTYECRKTDTLLLRYSSRLPDVKPYVGSAIVETNTYLVSADINNPEYKSLDFYNYLPYLDDNYKTNISMPTEKLEELLESIKNTPATNFTLPVIGQNDSVTLSGYKGQWVLLDFWFMACMPCRKLAPQIDEISKQYETKGLKVFGISTDENNEKLKDFVSKGKHSYPMLCSYGTEVPSYYKVSLFPTVILINPNQEIVFTGSGQDIADDLRTFLDENLK